MTDVDVEVIVIGAGPAGSTAALFLARSGIDVLLVDRHQFPRSKVCGDALIPDAIDMLKNIGLYDSVYKEGFSLSQFRIIAPNGDSILLNGSFITIKRILFDNLLCNAAISAGAKSAWNYSFENCIYENSKYKVEFHDNLNNKHYITSKYLIVATGANPLPLKNLGLLKYLRPTAIGIRRYVKAANTFEQELIFSYEKFLLPGYAWIFPLGNGTYNVGCGLFLHRNNNRINLHDLYNRFVTESPIARQVLSTAEEQSFLEGAPLWTGFMGSLVGNGSILVAGEALGLTYPTTGEGIGKCMKSGELVAKAIIAHRDEGYCRPASDLYQNLLDKEIKSKYLPYIISQKWLKYPFVPNMVVKQANKNESIRKLLEGILKEEVEPSRILSLWGLIKVMLRIT
ncbi:MAG: NAD(P)/FAD-dependent oxidoreductase [Nitrospinae bacterium]|nr:NAD(P)/FAD-dependent oxidoreductase [Nitrospinota bacterium]